MKKQKEKKKKKKKKKFKSHKIKRKNQLKIFLIALLKFSNFLVQEMFKLHLDSEISGE